MMFITKIIFVLVALYLIAGLLLCIRNFKKMDEKIEFFKGEGADRRFIREFIFVYYRTSIFEGPFIYVKSLFGLE